MLYINYNEYSQNTTKELKIAKDNLEKLNEELFKPPDNSRLVIKPEKYEKAKQDYLEALENCIKIYNNLVYQFKANNKTIAQSKRKEPLLKILLMK